MYLFYLIPQPIHCSWTANVPISTVVLEVRHHAPPLLHLKAPGSFTKGKNSLGTCNTLDVVAKIFPGYYSAKAQSAISYDLLVASVSRCYLLLLPQFNLEKFPKAEVTRFIVTEEVNS